MQYEYDDELLRKLDPIQFLVALRSDMKGLFHLYVSYLVLIEEELKGDPPNLDELVQLADFAKRSTERATGVFDGLDRYIDIHSRK